MRTPSQTVGPFFSIGLEHLRSQLSNDADAADAVRIQGRVLDGDGAGVPDAVLEFWYAAPDASRHFQRIFTDDAGAFAFTLTRPGGASDSVTPEASHVVVAVFMRGLLKHLFTRMYFAGDPRNDTDPVLALVPAARRETLFAAATPTDASLFHWNIVMQGSAETVFFQC